MLEERLNGLYEQYGYRKFRMSKFEDYDLYAQNKDFLKSGHIITFTDVDGALKALKPDITLSIMKTTMAAAKRSTTMRTSTGTWGAPLRRSSRWGWSR